MADFLNTSGPLTLGGTNITTAINALFKRGNDLGSYRGTTWYKADSSTGTFPSTNLSINDFYGKGPDIPFQPVRIDGPATGYFTAPTTAVYRFAIVGGGGGGGHWPCSANGGGGGGGAQSDIRMYAGQTVSYNVGGPGPGLSGDISSGTFYYGGNTTVGAAGNTIYMAASGGRSAYNYPGSQRGPGVGGGNYTDSHSITQVGDITGTGGNGNSGAAVTIGGGGGSYTWAGCAGSAAGGAGAGIGGSGGNGAGLIGGGGSGRNGGGGWPGGAGRLNIDFVAVADPIPPTIVNFRASQTAIIGQTVTLTWDIGGDPATSITMNGIDLGAGARSYTTPAFADGNAVQFNLRASNAQGAGTARLTIAAVQAVTGTVSAETWGAGSRVGSGAVHFDWASPEPYAWIAGCVNCSGSLYFPYIVPATGSEHLYLACRSDAANASINVAVTRDANANPTGLSYTYVGNGASGGWTQNSIYDLGTAAAGVLVWFRFDLAGNGGCCDSFSFTVSNTGTWADGSGWPLGGIVLTGGNVNGNQWPTFSR